MQLTKLLAITLAFLSAISAVPVSSAKLHGSMVDIPVLRTRRHPLFNRYIR